MRVNVYAEELSENEALQALDKEREENKRLVERVQVLAEDNQRLIQIIARAHEVST